MIYEVKVRANFPDGWGRDMGMETYTVGGCKFKLKEDAEVFMEKAKKMDEASYWCGEPWIESSVLR